MARMPSIESFKKKTADLVKKFKSQEKFYLSSEYNESQARIDFIDPFFSALGWDLSNSLAVPYHLREVILERGDDNSRDRPDYAFRAGGRIKFFVEAKAPHEPMSSIYHVHQAKSYAWSSPDASIAILTDFEELKIFDCRTIPEIDKPNKGLIKSVRYEDFVQNAEFLWKLSKQSVLSNSFDDLLEESTVTVKHRAKVDKLFLKHLMDWRTSIAQTIFKLNKSLSMVELDETIDLIVNRVVFLRVAEDREILTRPTLITLTATWKETESFSLWSSLLRHFDDINDDLNGVLFKQTDKLSKLKVDESQIHDFIMSLYFPYSPYRFDEIPIELLGTIYEQYLGKKFEQDGKSVELVDKPEVRKAGGVFYTPQKIVSTIIENNLNGFMKGKKYSEISNITVLDPACGSGSFLISAFGKLMEFHLEYLMKNPKEAAQGKFFPDLIQDDRGEWKLSIEKKRNILLNNIFGVDIDSQAIGICIMSLYLKALEGEQRLPNRKSLLPTLDNNLQCGNSLVSGTTKDLQALIGDSYHDRKPFNWGLHFPRVFKAKGGFDIIVMNPPYVKIQKMLEDKTNDVKFLQSKYRTTKDGSCDIYVAFIEKSLSLLNSEGVMGLICPHKFFQSEYGVELRKVLVGDDYLKELVSFGDIQIFDGASTYTCLLYCSKKKTSAIKFTKVKDVASLETGLQLSLECKTSYEDHGVVVDFFNSKDLLNKSEWHFVAGKEREPFEKLSVNPTFLEDLSEDIYQGVITGADDVFILDGKLNPKKDIQIMRSRELNEDFKIETSILKPMMQGFSDIKPFSLNVASAYIVFPYELVNGKAKIIPLSKMKSDFPCAFEYLKKNKCKLESREKGKWAGPDFYCYSRNQNLFKFCGEKLMMPYMVNKLTSFHDRSSQFYFVNVTTGGYSITLKEDSPISYGYLSGLLNSSVLNFYLKKVGSNFRGGFFPVSTQYLKRLPIVIPETKAQKSTALKIEQLMNAITFKLTNGKVLPDSEIFENQNELDMLVSSLYGVDDYLETLKVS